MGASLKAALALLGEKTNFSILLREGSSPGFDHAAKGDDELTVGKPEARTGEAQLHEEINLVSRGRKVGTTARKPLFCPGMWEDFQRSRVEFSSHVPETGGNRVHLSLTSFGKPSLKQRGMLVFISPVSYILQDFL